jgi:hypothetical protein
MNEVNFIHSGIKRGAMDDAAFRGFSDLLQRTPNVICSISETDASAPDRDGRLAVQHIVDLTGRPQDFHVIASSDRNVGLTMIVSAATFQESAEHPSSWFKLSGPENPKGGSGQHQHHRLDTWLNVMDPNLQQVVGKTLAVVAQHQTSLADINLRDPLNIRARKRQSYEAMALVAKYASQGMFAALLRDVNDFTFIDRIFEMRNRRRFDINAPTDKLGDYYLFDNVETDVGGLNEAFGHIRPFIKAISGFGVINRNVDSICLPNSTIRDWNIRTEPIHIALGDLDHGAIVLGVSMKVE